MVFFVFKIFICGKFTKNSPKSHVFTAVMAFAGEK